jgi:hypothetical protein
MNCRPDQITPGISCSKPGQHRIGHIDLCDKHYQELVAEPRQAYEKLLQRKITDRQFLFPHLCG